VVVYHLQFGAPVLFSWESATPFFTDGYLWVDLFFILSGFVISYSARVDERAVMRWPDVKSFWVTRFARIYPLHLFCLLMLLLVRGAVYMVQLRLNGPAAAGDVFSGPSMMLFLEQLFLLNAIGLTGMIGWNIPSWSISAEMIAYALFPALAALLVRGKLAAIAILGIGALIFYAWVGSTTGSLDIVKGAAVWRGLAGFSLGMIIYARRSYFERLPSTTLSFLQLIGVALALSTLLFGLNDVVAVPGFFLIIASTWPDRGVLARLLMARPLHWLGEISYSIYLNHFWVLASTNFVLLRALPRLGLGPYAAHGIQMGIEIALVLIVSAITYRMVETPARKAMLSRYRARLRPVAPAPA
jgi:peptidoglycan/LPS O-acetylase OafA/YrhL